MADIQYPPARPLSVGEVLDLSVRIYRRTLLKCLVLAGLAVLLSQVPALYNLAHGRYLVKGLNAFRDPTFDLIYVLSILLSSALYGAVLLRQHALISGQAAGGEIAAALRRTPAWVVLLLLFALGLGIPFALIRAALHSVVLASVCLLVAVTYFGIAFSCAWPLLFVKGAGPLQSLARSWQLTRGSFWRLSGLYTVAVLILLAVWLVFGVVSVSLGVILGRGDVLVAGSTASLFAVAAGALLAPFYTGLALAVLGDLMVRREGADLEQRIAATA